MTTLAADVRADDPYIVVGDPSGLILDEVYQIDSEYVQLRGAPNSRRIYVARGFLGTTKAAHSIGDTMTHVLFAAQTDAPSAPPTAGVVTIYSSTVILTDAQVKALPTTPVQLVAAPGPSKFIAPMSAWLYVDWHADYSNIGADARVGVGYAGTFNGVLSQFEGTGVDDLLADGASHVAFMGVRQLVLADVPRTLGIAQFQDEPGVINTALEIYAANGGATGDFSGGHAANTITVTVWYGVVDLV